MARNQLIIPILKAEIQKYLGIPYYRNRPGVSSPLNALVGKGNYQEIALATIAAAQKQNVNLLNFDNKKIYNFQKKNNIGIDCSGLTYHLLDKLYQTIHGQSIESCLIGTEGKLGPRRLNADCLTSSPNSQPVSSYSQVQPGDMIRMDKGRHVMFIFQKIGSKIYYANSSEHTKARGVHLGILTIINPDQPLNQQQWTDEAISGQPYNELIYPELGDGIYRLNCLYSEK